MSAADRQGQRMTPEAQRIAIAEVCGWKFEHDGCRAFAPFNACKKMAKDGAPDWREVPDYLTDLNAMHEAEKVLTPEQWADYIGFLSIDCGRRYQQTRNRFDYYNLHATAAQRAEAFLRTLNLWKP